MAILGWPYRWHPWKEMALARRQIEDLLASTRENALGWLGRGQEFPPLNITATPEQVTIMAQAPGMRQEDIDLTITGSTSAIKGERKPEEFPPNARYHRRERQSGEFVRAAQLPGRVDADQARATYRDGILTVTLPRVQESGPRRIAVK